MRELRPRSGGTVSIRILFVFDTERRARPHTRTQGGSWPRREMISATVGTDECQPRNQSWQRTSVGAPTPAAAP
nr:hypothetical protein [Streptomyces luteoverticillatus]